MPHRCPICRRKTMYENCHLLVVWCINKRCGFEAPWADTPAQWRAYIKRWKAQRRREAVSEA